MARDRNITENGKPKKLVAKWKGLSNQLGVKREAIFESTDAYLVQWTKKLKPDMLILFALENEIKASVVSQIFSLKETIK